MGHSEQAALLKAAASIPGTFARSLLPRDPIDQGIVTGSSTGLTYLLTVVVDDAVEQAALVLARRLPLGAGRLGEREGFLLVSTRLTLAAVGVLVASVLRQRPAEGTARALARRCAHSAASTAGVSAAVFAADAAIGVLGRRRNDGPESQLPIVVAPALAVTLFLEWQRLRSRDRILDQGDAPEGVEGEVSSVWLALSLATPIGVVGATTGLAYGEKLLADKAAGALAAVLPGPPRLWRLAARTALPAVGGVGCSWLWSRIMARIEEGATAIDPRLEAHRVMDSLPSTFSGSAASLAPWETLGDEGRLHAALGLRPEPEPDRERELGVPDFSIRTVMGETPRSTPVQVYVGLDSAKTMQARVALALAEMDRVSAWERALIVLVSPTGTGYVNYCAAAAIGYLTRGDVAMVTMQYSKRPSVLSLSKMKTAEQQNRLLWLAVSKRLRDTPPAGRPRVVLFGESLGAQTSQGVLAGWGTLGLQALGIDRALWIGTPYASVWMHEVLRTDRADVTPGVVRVVNDFAQLEAMAPARRSELRYVLVSHDNDGVAKFGVDLLAARPRWLTDRRPRFEAVPGSSPRGVPAEMRWRPLTTFVQLLVDMKNSQDFPVYRSWAHDYRPDLPRFLCEVFDLPSSEGQLVAIEQAIKERESIRERLASVQ